MVNVGNLRGTGHGNKKTRQSSRFLGAAVKKKQGNIDNIVKMRREEGNPKTYVHSVTHIHIQLRNIRYTNQTFFFFENEYAHIRENAANGDQTSKRHCIPLPSIHQG